MTIQRTAAPAPATYSQSTVVAGPGQWIFISGQLPVDASGAITAVGLADQSRACFANLEGALKAAGADLGDVVRITTYLTGLENYGDFAGVRGETFVDGFPVSTAVGVASLLFGALIEIDAVAFLPDVRT
jgi:2-iminobutanoate/2-iminopropanoate deaminase